MVKHASLWKAIPLAFLIALATLMYPLFAPQTAYADPISFQETSITLTGADETNAWFFTTDNSVSIASAVSSDESVAIVSKIEGGFIVVEPVSDGKATITVTGTDSSTTTLEIIVPLSYMNKRVKASTSIWSYWYGSKKVYISSNVGAKGTLTIGKDKYSFKIGKKGEVTVKLKRLYKVGTKLTCKIANGKYKASIKDKIFSGTGFEGASAKKKTVSVDCYSLTKGDVVKLTYKGKTYTKKIKKNKARYTVKFKVKNKVKKNAKLKVVIKNKFNQKLYSESFKLSNGAWSRPDEDELYEDEYTE